MSMNLARDGIVRTGDKPPRPVQPRNRVDVDASAVRDAGGNPIDQTRRNAITVVDDVAPEIVYATFDRDADMLEVGFSDRIDVTPASYFYLNGMTVRGSGQSVSLTDAVLETEADSAGDRNQADRVPGHVSDCHVYPVAGDR